MSANRPARIDGPADISGALDSRAQLATQMEVAAASLLLPPVAVLIVAVAGFACGLPMGALTWWIGVGVAAVALRPLTSSWQTTLLVAGASLVLHAVLGLAAAAVADGSWDGLAYQQEAILRLADGWNPLFEDAARYGTGNDIFINHYAKAAWIPGAAVLLATGHVEAGKLFHITLMLAAFCQVGAALLRLSSLHRLWVLALAALAALSPVAVSQTPSFLIDGMVGSLLTVVVAGTAAYIGARTWRPLVIVMLASCFAINLKLTGLVFVGVLLVLAVMVDALRNGLLASRRLFTAAAIVGSLSVFVVGYDPYVQNTLETGYPFYPTYGPKPPPMDIAPLRPVNLNDKDRLQRFLISNFSRTEVVRAPNSSHLKWPLTFGPGELRGAYNVGTEIGGFGPLYGAMLLLATAGAIGLAVRAETRRLAGWALVAAGCVLVSAFVHSETWWARYAPQSWLVPLVIAAACLAAPRRPARLAGLGIVGLASLNLFIITANIAWDQLLYEQRNRAAFDAVRQSPQPVTVYFGGFGALRRRLQEAGVDYTVVMTPPDGSSTRHPFATVSGESVWIEPAPKDSTR